MVGRALKRVRARRLRNLPARALLKTVAVVSSGRPVPLSLIRLIRSLASESADPLGAPARPILGQSLTDPFLAGQLHGRILGTWALGPETIEFVRRMVLRDRPRLVLEFGSGLSTVALAASMRDSDGRREFPSVISIEQDDDHAELTRDLLKQAGLEDDVAIVVAPLGEQTIEGLPTVCYLIPDVFAKVIGDRLVDFVLVDGPAAEPGARFATIPLVRSHLRDGAKVVLDDALRDGELETARRWAALPYVKVQGIRLIEKGVLIGKIEG
jgi:predicted O-methyltransferase YrrM